MGNCLPCLESSARENPAPKKEEYSCSIAGYGFEEPAKSTEVTAVVTESVKAPEPVKPAAEPEPPRPEKPARTDPITLDVLQGEWVNTMGAKIVVADTQVSLNGLPMKMHPVKLREDGSVASIGTLWQCKCWMTDDRIEFKEAPSPEVMEYARSVIWTPANERTMEAWQTHMNNLGYAGSSSDVLNRGVEGCCPGTSDAAAKIVVDDKERDKKELQTLNDIISKYKEPGMHTVPPRKVIPDFSNRGHTGLSVEHVHYLAQSFQKKGFIKRVGNTGHDIPVLVRESSTSDLGSKSIGNWREKLAEESGFPPKEHYERLFKQEELFTSLGNGHFNQALNMFFTESPGLYAGEKYIIGEDHDLKVAAVQGVSSVVLRNEITLRERETISKLLNSKREFKWNVNADGSLNILDAHEDLSHCKQFEAMSKVLDAQELNCLVRSELGIKDSHRMGQ